MVDEFGKRTNGDRMPYTAVSAVLRLTWSAALFADTEAKSAARLG